MTISPIKMKDLKEGQMVSIRFGKLWAGARRVEKVEQHSYGTSYHLVIEGVGAFNLGAGYRGLSVHTD